MYSARFPRVTTQGAEREVFSNGQPGEQPSTLRHQADAESGDLLRSFAVDALGAEQHASGGRPDETHDALEGRRLAGAVAAEERHDLVLADAKRDVVQHVALAVERIDRVDLDDRRRVHFRALDPRCGRPDRAVAEIHALQLGVGAHLARSAFGDHASLVHRGDAIGKLEDAIHVVLDEQDRHLRHEAADKARDPLALAGGEPDQRLVEQQHARSRRERNADLEQALAAVGQAGGRYALQALESEEADERCGLRGDLAERR